MPEFLSSYNPHEDERDPEQLEENKRNVSPTPPEALNPIRQLKGLSLVWQNWRNEQAKRDARLTHEGPAYLNLSFTFTKSTYIAELWNLVHAEYRDNRDAEGELLDRVCDLRQFWLEHGFRDEALVRKMTELLSVSPDGLTRKLMDDPLTRDLPREQLDRLIWQIAALKQFRQALSTQYSPDQRRQLLHQVLAYGKFNYNEQADHNDEEE